MINNWSDDHKKYNTILKFLPMTAENVRLVTRKPVFEVADQVIPKPACSATETG